MITIEAISIYSLILTNLILIAISNMCLVAILTHTKTIITITSTTTIKRIVLSLVN